MPRPDEEQADADAREAIHLRFPDHVSDTVGAVGEIEPDPEEEDPTLYGFEAEPFDERLAATVEAVHGMADRVRQLWSFLVAPVEFLFALLHAYAEVRLIQSPDRRLRDLAQALPAVIVVAAALGLTIAGAVHQRGLAAEYRALASKSLERGDAKAVRVYAGREYDLEGSDESLYRLAEAYGRLGDSARSDQLMRHLADGPGYGPAHLWLADRLLADPAALTNADRLAEVTGRLRQAEAAGVDADDVAPRMARVLLAGGEVAAALPYLERASDADPVLRVDLAAVYARLGRTEDARIAASAAEQDFHARVAANPGDRDSRAKWAACLLNLGRSGEAVAALEDAGRDNLARDAILGELYVLACLAREREIAAANGPARERLAWVRRALDVRPRAEPALLRLIEMAQEMPADEATEADQALAAALTGGEASPAVSVALGTRAWKEGDFDAALAHLERAFAADPSNVVAANNVAWLLARRQGPDLDRALSIADTLVGKYPDAAQFRDTRGQILAKLGRWEEALIELERALPAMRDSVETRRALAEAYRGAGQPNLAELQDREADQLEATAKSGGEGAEPPAP